MTNRFWKKVSVHSGARTTSLSSNARRIKSSREEDAVRTAVSFAQLLVVSRDPSATSITSEEMTSNVTRSSMRAFSILTVIFATLAIESTIASDKSVFSSTLLASSWAALMS